MFASNSSHGNSNSNNHITHNTNQNTNHNNNINPTLLSNTTTTGNIINANTAANTTAIMTTNTTNTNIQSPNSPNLLNQNGLLNLDTYSLKIKRLTPRKQSCSFSESTLLNGHSDAVSALVVYKNWLISGSWDSSIKIWATDTWACVRTLSDHTGRISHCCSMTL